MKPTAISLILLTYQWPEALDRVLESLACQSHAPSEILVADDGSDARTAACVERWQDRLGVSLQHVWQADRGFRAASARNRAAARASADYLLFVDGDCLALTDFVAWHERLAARGRFVAGNRLLVTRDLTQRILVGDARPLDWRIGDWLAARWRGDVNRLSPLVRMPQGSWRDWRGTGWRNVQSCNLGVWRDDFLAVNGFDEAFNGWGHEDADLAVRLLRLGLNRRDGQFATGLLHLWHGPADRSRESGNRSLLEASLAGRRPLRAALGLDQYQDST